MVSPVRMLPPKNLYRSAPQLSDAQHRVVNSPAGHEPILVVGGPGTGKTTVAVEYAVAKLVAGTATNSVLMLTNSRLGAAQLRSQLTARLNHEHIDARAETPVRSFASYAFDVINRIRADEVTTPRLLAGAEQDRFLAEIIDGYVNDPQLAVAWPEGLQEAVGLKGLRKELRELIDRCAEYDIEPGQLEALGRAKGRAEWVTAAMILQDYRDILDLSGDDAYDPSGLITAAANLLEANPKFAAQEAQRVGHVVIDDFQDATPAIHRLVKLIAGGRDVVITANPDTTVQGFRGAHPQAIGQWFAGLGKQPTTVVFDTSYRMGPAITQAYQRTVNRIPAVAGLPDTRTVQLPAAHDDALGVHRFTSDIQEHLFIVQQVLELHHRHGVTFDDIAVLARTASKVAEVATALESEEIPVVRSISEVMLNQQPAAAPLLTLTAAADAVVNETAQTATGLEPTELHWLITGRYGTTTPLELRTVRRRLLATERAAQGTRDSIQLLDTLVANPDQAYELLGLDPEKPYLPKYAVGPVRIGNMLQAMIKATIDDAASAEMVLWAGWNTALRDIGETWEQQALSDDTDASVRANRDLDATVALFEAAERYVVQFPGQTALGFTEYLAEQDLPMDSLTARIGQHGVSVLTPTTAAGHQWDTVFVVGVQEGIWPNTRLRGQLLHTQELVEEVTGTATTQPLNERIAQVRHDELRTFSAAISRASNRLFATAVADADNQPSMFIERLDPWTPTDNHPVRPYTTVATPLTSSGLITELRAKIETIHRELANTQALDQHHDSQRVEELTTQAQQCATALAVLADGGMYPAHPDDWWGLAPLSTTNPIHGVDEQGQPNRIRLSPSTVGTAVESPLQWFLYQVAPTASGSAAVTGTFLHAIVEKFPDANVHDMFQELRTALPTLAKSIGIEQGKEYDALEDKAVAALEKFHEYAQKMTSGYDIKVSGQPMNFGPRTLVATEYRANVDMDFDDVKVQLRGSMDRVEVDNAGRPYITDIKTGSTVPSAEKIKTFPQLGVYQAMVKAGALQELVPNTQPAGAALIQLGQQRASVNIQHQSPLDETNSWAEHDIADAARWIQGPYFYTAHQTSDCRIGALCPLCKEGQQVTEWLI